MKFLKIAAVMLGTLFVAQAPVLAQTAGVEYARGPKAPFADVRSLGVGLVIIGAAVGIGWLARAAVEAMARQPEVAGNIQTAMIIAAALIEGVSFFALIIIMLFLSPWGG
jgi:F-type H+-transporting ATPase subunit c